MLRNSIESVVRSGRAGQLDLPSLIAAFVPYLRIAHQIPGRVRLKIDLAVIDDGALRTIGTDGLSDALGVIRGVRDIKVNLLARSCTVEYDKAIIPDAAWGDLIAERQTPAAGVLVGILQEKHEEVRDGKL